jgi:hypothetical protein
MDSQQDGGEVPVRLGSGLGRILTLVILALLLVAALGFGGWAYSKMLDYKNNSDKKAAAAVVNSKKQITADLQAQFDEQSKSPNKTFHGPPTYGTITFNYPKTWSGYVDSSNSTEPIDGYFHPDVVPGTQSKTAYALRVELLSTDYSDVLGTFDGDIGQGKLTSRAYIPPKMQGAANVTAGVYLSGQINSNDQTQRGNMVVLKVRDKTLEIYSESNTFADDFNKTILGSLVFNP